MLSASLRGPGLVVDFAASAPQVLVVRRVGKGLRGPIIVRRVGSERGPDVGMTLRVKLRIRQGQVNRLTLRTIGPRRRSVELCAPCTGPGAGIRVTRIPNDTARALFSGRAVVEAWTSTGVVRAPVLVTP